MDRFYMALRQRTRILEKLWEARIWLDMRDLYNRAINKGVAASRVDCHREFL